MTKVLFDRKLVDTIRDVASGTEGWTGCMVRFRKLNEIDTVIVEFLSGYELSHETKEPWRHE